ncbi:MAG: ATP-binding protein [Saprospirales bacterium]|nr:ATP-binding protein [Saprospirales bacterium]
MIEIELKGYIFANYPRENESCEWKGFHRLTHDVSGRRGDDVISYVSGLANMNGGHLVIGIEDKTGNITGISDTHDYTPENLPPAFWKCPNLDSEGLKVDVF